VEDGADYGGASVGEGLWAAAKIRDLGVESWPDVFAALGDHQQQEGNNVPHPDIRAVHTTCI